MQNIGEKIYDSSAELGTFTTMVKSIIAVVVALIFIAIGIYLYKLDQSDLVDGTATVTSSDCVANRDNRGNLKYSCNLGIKYVVDSKEYTGTIIKTGNMTNAVGTLVDITYNSKNPAEVKDSALRYKTIAYVMFGIAVVLLLGVGVNYYMTSRFKIYAAAEGASTTLSVLSSPFRSSYGGTFSPI
jgi:hypothetical protein